MQWEIFGIKWLLNCLKWFSEIIYFRLFQVMWSSPHLNMQNYLDLTLFFSSLFFTIAAGFTAECRTSFSNKDHMLIGHVMRTLKSKSFQKCTFSCELDSRCFSVNYFLWDKTCELNNASANSSPGHLVSRKGVVCIDMVIRKDEPCVSMRCGNGGTCVVSSKVQCNCVQGFIGPRCESMNTYRFVM